MELLWRPWKERESQRGRFWVVPRTSETILLFTGAVSADSGIIWGALGHDINLTIPGIQGTKVDEVRWVKGGNLVAQSKRNTKGFSKSEAFEILADGSLHIKQLKRDDNGTYDVEVYDVHGKSKLQKAFRLRILGESSLSGAFHFSSRAR